MLSPLICGASFQTDEDNLPCGAASSSPSPRKSWGGRRGGRNNSNNNPYAGRGLDKFSQLLSDLAEKRLEIYSTMSSQDPPLVRFVFPGATSDAVPVVIKIRDPKPSKSAELKDHPHHNHNHRNLKHSNSTAFAAAAEQAVTNSTSDQQHKLPAVGEIVEESVDFCAAVTGSEEIDFDLPPIVAAAVCLCPRGGDSDSAVSGGFREAANGADPGSSSVASSPKRSPSISLMCGLNSF